MTELQILDLQLTGSNYYWCKVKYWKKHIIVEYFIDKYIDSIEIYMCGSEVSLDLNDIEYLNPNRITENKQ